MIRVKEESENADLKLNIQITKTMTSVPITSWQIDGGKVEAVVGFIFLASESQWTVAKALRLKDACSLEGKLRKNPDSVLKSRDITLPTKVRIIQAVFFAVVMYGCLRVGS